MRRALSNVGGETETSGDAPIARVLATALDVSPREDAARAHVHGFHSYPARLHPDIARACITAFSTRGATILDPFCGSGTVLVEGRIAGRNVAGADLNPLAVRLAELKSAGRSPAHLAAMIDAAAAVTAVADERRKRSAGASRRYPNQDVVDFDPHVLLELDGLRVGLDGVADGRVKADLELVFSSILTKVGRRRGDTSDEVAPKRIAAGFPARLFLAKTRELADRIAAFVALLPENAPSPNVFEDDARRLANVPDGVVDLVVSSPPYAGNYDYLQHHLTRLRWLGLRATALRDGEIGARRTLEAEPARAAQRWRDELVAVLRAMHRVLRRSGHAIVVLADSVVAGRAFYNDDELGFAARDAGMRVLARASQTRPHFHRPTQHAFRARPRREHAVCLVKA